MRSHRSSVPVRAAALAALCLFAAAASGQDKLPRVKPDAPPVGAQAKDFQAVEVLNTRPTQNPFQALKGRAVLLTMFLAGEKKPEHKACLDTIPDLNAYHDKYGPRGLTVLACSDQDKPTVETYVGDKRVKFSWALLDKATADQFVTDWPVPQRPWSFLIDADRKIVWQGHPREVPKEILDPVLAATKTPPILPHGFEAQQKLLDDQAWGAAWASLLEGAKDPGLERIERNWLTWTAEWIQMRHDQWLGEADALCRKGWWWEGRETARDYVRRFEGMPGGELGLAKEKEITETPDAKWDLSLGDSVAKAKAFIAAKKFSNAKMILVRIAKEGRNTRHGPRAEVLLGKLE